VVLLLDEEQHLTVEMVAALHREKLTDIEGHHLQTGNYVTAAIGKITEVVGGLHH
jgi:hypothetical protein